MAKPSASMIGLTLLGSIFVLGMAKAAPFYGFVNSEKAHSEEMLGESVEVRVSFPTDSPPSLGHSISWGYKPDHIYEVGITVRNLRSRDVMMDIKVPRLYSDGINIDPIYFKRTFETRYGTGSGSHEEIKKDFDVTKLFLSETIEAEKKVAYLAAAFKISPDIEAVKWDFELTATINGKPETFKRNFHLTKAKW